MSRGDFLISMMASFARGDHEGFLEDCQALISYEESKKNYGLANKMRKALEGGGSVSKLSTSSFSVTPIDTKRMLKNSKNETGVQDLFTLEKPWNNLGQVILSKQTEKLIVNVIEQWRNKEKLIPFNLTPQNRLLFYGPPGTGKTFTAYGIANALGLEVAYVRFDSLVSSYLGQTGSNLREVFEYVSKNPCVLLLDELDAIGKKRDDNQELGELKRIVISLLQNIDYFPAHSIIIACTNHSHLLDEALWRRFDCVVPFNNPEVMERKKLFLSRLEDRNLKIEEHWITFFAEVSEGISAANIVQIVDNGVRKWALEKTYSLPLVIMEEIIRHLKIEDLPEKSRVSIAEKLRGQSRNYSLSYLSDLLKIPRSTLHKRLNEKI